MARTKSGVLELSKAERESLALVRGCAKANIEWGEGGYFVRDDGEGVDKATIVKARRGIDTIDFILQVTE